MKFFLLNLVVVLSINSAYLYNFKKRSGSFYGPDYYSIIPHQFYERITQFETVTMYEFIFDRIQFSNEYCNYVFQNCLMDTTNNHQIQKVSSECFPLKKSTYCLLKPNFDGSDDCDFRLIHERIRTFQHRLHKNLEACTSLFPNYSSIYLLNEANSNKQKQFLFVIVLFHVLFLFCK